MPVQWRESFLNSHINNEGCQLCFLVLLLYKSYKLHAIFAMFTVTVVGGVQNRSKIIYHTELHHRIPMQFQFNAKMCCGISRKPYLILLKTLKNSSSMF